MAAIEVMQKKSGHANPILILAFLVAAAAGIAVLWYRSYTNADLITFYTPAGRVQAVASVEGSFVMCFTSVSLGPERGLALRCETADLEVAHEIGVYGDNATNTVSRFGLGGAFGKFDGFGGVTDAMLGRWIAIWCPDWCPILFVILTASAMLRRQWIRYHRDTHGMCANCGYDLRSSPDLCPECGVMPAALAAQISAKEGGVFRRPPKRDNASPP